MVELGLMDVVISARQEADAPVDWLSRGAVCVFYGVLVYRSPWLSERYIDSVMGCQLTSSRRRVDDTTA